MVYSIKNSETGEVDYIYTDSTDVERPRYDEETGEPLNDRLKVRYRKHSHFHVPKQYLRGTVCDEFENRITNRNQDRPLDIVVTTSSIAEHDKPTPPKKAKKQLYEREDYIAMEGVNNEIILGYSKSNYILFLIPTLFIFNWFIAFLLALIEICFHCWAHKKNSLTMNKDLYFRSPMHILSSQYCALCRAESDLEFRIFDMLNKQMRAARKLRTLKDVSKAMG